MLRQACPERVEKFNASRGLSTPRGMDGNRIGARLSVGWIAPNKVRVSHISAIFLPHISLQMPVREFLFCFSMLYNEILTYAKRFREGETGHQRACIARGGLVREPVREGTSP